MYEKLHRYIKRQFYSNSLYGLGFQTQCYLSEYFRYHIDLWAAWYTGYYAEFHDYFYYNGRERVKVERKHLNMAKQVCEDKASLLMNEKFDINLEDENQTEKLREILDRNLFNSRANELIERTQALGTGAFVEYLHNGEVGISYITARNVIPLIVENEKVISCAFVDVYKSLDNITYDVDLHLRIYPAEDEETAAARIEMGIDPNYNGYIIENRILKEVKSGEIVEDLDDPRNREFYMTNTTIPFFQVIKPNIANNVCFTELDNGMGISVYANALSVLESVDNAYDNLDNEIVCGRKRIIVHDDYAQINIQTDQNGATVALQPVFDKNDTTFFAMDLGDTADPIREINMDLRIAEATEALNMQLSILSMRCGLGNNYYKFEGGQVKTATEIISDNNPLFRNLKKEETILEESLIEMTKAIMYLANNSQVDTLTGETITKMEFTEGQEISINFGDSILEDTNAVRQAKLLEFQSGIIDKIQYFVDVYHMTEELATELVTKMEKRAIDLMIGAQAEQEDEGEQQEQQEGEEEESGEDD